MTAHDPSPTREQLSALLDGELPAPEVDLALRRVTRDPELRATAIRYCLITDVIRGDLPTHCSLDLVDRVAQSMDSEPEPAAATVATPPAATAPASAAGRWARRLGGLAVAASVAGLAIVSLQTGDPENASQPELVVVPDAAVPAPAFAQPRSIARSAGNPDRLVSYYVSHVERVAPVGVQTGFSRIVMSEERVSRPREAERDSEAERREDKPE
jgi:negative regulator of sigma E activity